MKKTFGSIECGFEIEAKGTSKKCVSQVHGAKIVEFQEGSSAEADGVFTFKDNENIHIFTADCIPLLYFSSNPALPLVAVHCGWRGALLGIARRGAELFQDADFQVLIGPSILACCFEVKDDFIEAFEEKGHKTAPYLKRTNEKTYFDLVAFIEKTQLQKATVHKEWSRCTYCSSPALPSYRRNRSTDPQIRSWIRRSS